MMGLAGLLGVSVGQEAVPKGLTYSDAVKVCQVGYLPNETKFAMITAEPKGPVNIQSVTAHANGPLIRAVKKGIEADSGDTVWWLDFSSLKTPGEYYLEVPGVGASRHFTIGKDIFATPFRLAIRSFYGQRSGVSVDLGPDYPQYRFDAGHTALGEYHESAGKTGKRDVSGGWYDAGDYGKYIVNSGITTGTLLHTWEQYGGKLRRMNLNIPESGGPQPDFLDEIKWNVDWMLKMQDDDGGVWHKATTANFPGFVLPKADLDRVLVIGPKNTPATADFAAVTAIAARAFRKTNPDYADRCLRAAERAWVWVEGNPGVLYPGNPKGIGTGGYGDSDASDERLWASAELFRTTGKAVYHRSFLDAQTKWTPALKAGEAQGWGNVSNLAFYTYLFASGKDAPTAERIRKDALTAADGIVARIADHGYRMPLGSNEYYWGSNSVVANYAIMLLFADRLNGKNPAYKNGALDCLHYLLGRNTFNTSFVTGVGSKWAMHPHHRPSGADGIDQPWPGLLVGGPNADNGIKPPARQWFDEAGSYRTNENAINWNAALVFALAGVLP
ncbi:glycosyl hydrolase family 5 [bacterium]|nr:MAG: glycosyl hydrolase family 5 [bacterium]